MTVDDMEYVILGLVGLVHYSCAIFKIALGSLRGQCLPPMSKMHSFRLKRRSELRDCQNEGGRQQKELVAERAKDWVIVKHRRDRESGAKSDKIQCY